MSLFESVMIALLAITVPFVMPSIKLISARLAVIEVPAICSVVAFTSPELPYITALLLTIVPADEPSVKFNSAPVASTVPNFVKSACTNPDTPSSKFNSVAVAVSATSSFIFGEVSVLFVSVAVDAVDTRSTSPPVLGSVSVLDALSECGAPVVTVREHYLIHSRS